MATNSYEKALVWFRRDLRDYDHAALYHALNAASQVYCVFVFDTDILDQLKNKADRRVDFIWHALSELKTALQSHGGDLIVMHGRATQIIPKLAEKLQVQAVFSNRDYEPATIQRDAEVASQLLEKSTAFHQYKDQVIFEKDQLLTLAGKPYGVFTPYKNTWLKTVQETDLQPYLIDGLLKNLAPAIDSNPLPSLASLGFTDTKLAQLGVKTGMQGGLALFDDFKNRMVHYQEARNFPAVKGVSYLSVHLRFGTVSIRHLARTAMQAANAGAQTWLNELIWRNFYVQILHHHPQLASGQAYKAELQHLAFSNDEALFAAWCQGRTGYPLVDAAMRQLNSTGFMHNRLRMIVASFLVKDLLVDWRWGERYFANNLIDFDFSANNGGWQWAASTGCDAQPWFRIFNPVTQSERFDQAGKFIRRYVPELAACNEQEIHAPWVIGNARLQALNLNLGVDYPMPVVDHATQRGLALALYKNS